MLFKSRNLSIKNSSINNKELHLFKYIKPGFVEYVGEMEYINDVYKDGIDVDKLSRKLIIF
jgi:hypothetical protein